MKFLAVHIRGSSHPDDVKPYLNKARIILKEILEIIKEIRILEGNLIEMTKLLKKKKEYCLGQSVIRFLIHSKTNLLN